MCVGSYSEDRDGFSFSRRKKAAPKQKSAPAEKETEQSARAGRRKKSSNTASAPPPEAGTRRSARLSGDSVDSSNSNSQKQAEGVPNSLAEPAASPKRREKRPNRESSHPAENPAPIHKTPEKKSNVSSNIGGELHVDKKRETTKIALPFADTPVITRNKEMRKTSAETRRRSSSGMRGRRASSLIDSGFSNGEIHRLETIAIDFETHGFLAVPHNEVMVSDFYKHISQDLPEPRRMKQLLTWCGARALPEKPPNGSGDVDAILAGMRLLHLPKQSPSG